MNATISKFQVGKSYSCRSLCDHNCIFTFEVVARTPQFVTIKAPIVRGGQAARKVRVLGTAEQLDPLGRYSMSPVLSASNVF